MTSRHRTDRLPWHRAAGRAVTSGLLVALVAVGTSACAGPARPTTVAGTSSTDVLAPAPTTSIPSVPAPVEAPHLARSTPVRVQVPAIGVDSPLMSLGLKPDGTMEVPPTGFPAGWYTGAPTPGELGPAVIAGHVDWNGPGVFYRLHELKPGDGVSVTREDGSVAVFRVTKVDQYAKSTFPTDQVYGDIDVAGLRLITCGGSWNPKTQHYEDNVVAFAELVPPAS